MAKRIRQKRSVIGKPMTPQQDIDGAYKRIHTQIAAILERADSLMIDRDHKIKTGERQPYCYDNVAAVQRLARALEAIDIEWGPEI